MKDIDMEATKTVPNALNEGAEAVRQLLLRIGHISDTTCTPDADTDGRDYARMTDLVQAEMADLPERAEEYREGFARALAHLLCLNADGSGISDTTRWDPISDTSRDRPAVRLEPEPYAFKFTSARPVYSLDRKAVRFDVHSQLTARLSHLSALLVVPLGEGFKPWNSQSEFAKENYLWACHSIAEECDDLISAIDHLRDHGNRQ